MKITNPQKQALRMRLRLNYSMNGGVIKEQGEVNDFPAVTWQ
jgi:AP-1 complex subunit gamma-1